MITAELPKTSSLPIHSQLNTIKSQTELPINVNKQLELIKEFIANTKTLQNFAVQQKKSERIHNPENSTFIQLTCQYQNAIFTQFISDKI